MSDRPFSQSNTYTLVISVDQAHMDHAPNYTLAGVRIFFEDDTYHSPDTMFSDGSQMNALSEQEVVGRTEALRNQLESEHVIILCRNLSYDRVVKALDMFYDRANVYVFYDNDGQTLDRLKLIDPVVKYELGGPRFSLDPWTSTAPPPQNNENNHGCLIALAATALVLLIIVLVTSLL